MTTYYVKEGRRYRPVSEYDNHGLAMAFPAGSHLVCVAPGVTSTRYNVDPAYAPLLAALKTCREDCLQVLREASEACPASRPNTPIEAEAWRAYAAVLKRNDAILRLSVPSANDVLDALEKCLLANVKAP